MKRLVPVATAVAVLAALVATLGARQGRERSDDHRSRPRRRDQPCRARAAAASARSASSPRRPASIPRCSHVTEPDADDAPGGRARPPLHDHVRDARPDRRQRAAPGRLPLREAEPGDLRRARASATSATEKTVGGWYVAVSDPEARPRRGGLPASPPGGEVGSLRSWTGRRASAPRPPRGRCCARSGARRETAVGRAGGTRRPDPPRQTLAGPDGVRRPGR